MNGTEARPPSPPIGRVPLTPRNDPCAADGSFHLGPLLLVARLERLRNPPGGLLGLLCGLLGHQLVLRLVGLAALALTLVALLVGREPARLLALGAGADLVGVHGGVVPGAGRGQTRPMLDRRGRGGMADAMALGAIGRKPVEVRLLSPALSLGRVARYRFTRTGGSAGRGRSGSMAW